jgi:hypothetical protein
MDVARLTEQQKPRLVRVTLAVAEDPATTLTDDRVEEIS